jgi:hypothetical protein
VTSTETRTEKGISLARGPALILGTILLAAGLYMIYKQHVFSPFSYFTNGTPIVKGKVFGLFEANGWTGMLTAVAGGLLLFGAAQHLLAKTMSLIVGVALGAAAVIALISGNVLGMAAANGWTELAWAIAAAILLLNSLIPRRRKTVEIYDPPARRPVRRRDEAVGAGAAAGTGAAVGDRESGLARAPDTESTRVRPAGATEPDDPTVVQRDDRPTTVDRDDAPGVAPGGAQGAEGAETADGAGTADDAQAAEGAEHRVRSSDDPA